jgi:hypothetical protein
MSQKRSFLRRLFGESPFWQEPCSLCFPLDDSSVIRLGYAEDVDWLKNVHAEGEATTL